MLWQEEYISSRSHQSSISYREGTGYPWRIRVSAAVVSKMPLWLVFLDILQCVLYYEQM